MQATSLSAALLVSLAIATPASAAAQTAADPPHVGFEIVSVPDGAGAPITAGIWYPTAAAPGPERLGGWTQVVARGAPVAPGRHPLVVMSHGNGGWFAGHHDTALALARAGFVVAAPTHPGDNYEDQSRATDMGGRVGTLDRMIDFVVEEWPRRGSVDPRRIGAFGFSAGGFTALVASGGVPDFSALVGHCAANPDADDCSIIAATGVPLPELIDTLSRSLERQPVRIGAVVLAAPALGFTFLSGGLRELTIPVQLWRAGDDRVLPFPHYADAIRRALPRPPEYHVVAGAGHFDFLAPCDEGLASRIPAICASAPGFDRHAFHERFNREVVAFFGRTLRMPP